MAQWLVGARSGLVASCLGWPAGAGCPAWSGLHADGSREPTAIASLEVEGSDCGRNVSGCVAVRCSGWRNLSRNMVMRLILRLK